MHIPGAPLRGAGGSCARRSAAIPVRNSISRDPGRDTAVMQAALRSARSSCGVTTSARSWATRTASGSSRAATTDMPCAHDRAHWPAPSRSETLTLRSRNLDAIYEPFIIATYAAAGFRPEALRRAPSPALTRWRRLFQECIGLPRKPKKVATASQTVSYWSAAYISFCNGVAVFTVIGGVLGFLLVAKHYL